MVISLRGGILFANKCGDRLNPSYNPNNEPGIYLESDDFKFKSLCCYLTYLDVFLT